jgi:DNA modification methylase
MTFDQKITDKYALYHGDCIDVVRDIPSNTIGYSMFSPPFADLYCYSNDPRDMGNSKGYDEFFAHFNFLISEIYRVVMHGRAVSVHCIDIPAMKERDGYLGLKDFPGDIIRAFQAVGFIYHSRVTIWKNPLIEATRTKALGLMHKQLCKDSATCRQGLPDYVITMRKPGDNQNPINNGEGLNCFIGENEPNQSGIKYSHEVWRRYASPVWMDIRQTRTLSMEEARDAKDEKHICPLQLDTIERCMTLWSKNCDTFLTPFAGIGSEACIAVKMGRKPIGIELKPSYYKQMCLNVENYAKKTHETLFKRSDND